jgi:arginine/lysine/ornithine decarboxylase
MTRTEHNPGATTLDHRDVPVVEHIRELRRREIVPYLSIGHRLGAAADPEIVDLLGEKLFKSNAWLTSGAYEPALEHAERLAADAWGAERAFYLVDGSSAGNHALLLATLKPGDEVIVSRDLHWSLLVGLILAGASPVYVSPELDVELDVGLGIDPVAIERAILEHPAARLVAIVSPSWCGVNSDIAAIADIAHLHGLPLYVDQAWGPHFHFHPELPASAMDAGADAAVVSVHKILPAVSQGSMLLIKGGRIDHDRVATAVRMMSTTSPMLPIVATLDVARRQMAIDGERRLSKVIDLARWARTRIDAMGVYSVLSDIKLGLPEGRQDITKLVIDVHRLGRSGYDVERMLNEQFSIAVESGDWRGIVANFNLGDTAESAEKFVDALREIAREGVETRDDPALARATGVVLERPVQAMSPRDAYFSKTRRMRMSDSAGEIAAELVTPYPPGIPVLAPGEVITSERIDYLDGVYSRGAVDYGKRQDRSDRYITVVVQE